jgi:hypothetical protein
MLGKLLLATATIAFVASPASARYRHHQYRHFSYGYGRPAYGYNGYGYPAYRSYSYPSYGYRRPNYGYNYPNYGYSQPYSYPQSYSPYGYNGYQGYGQRRGGEDDNDDWCTKGLKQCVKLSSCWLHYLLGCQPWPLRRPQMPAIIATIIMVGRTPVHIAIDGTVLPVWLSAAWEAGSLVAQL